MLLKKTYNLLDTYIYIRVTVGYIKFRTINFIYELFPKTVYEYSLCISLNYRFYGGSIFVLLSLRNRKQRDSVIMLHSFATPKIYSIGLYRYKGLLVLHE